MRLLVAAERLGPAGGMERALDVLLPALVRRGIAVHAVAREVVSAPEGVTAEPCAWADEHDPPNPSANAAFERIIARFAPDAALAANVVDAGVVTALRGVPRFAYQVHDHRPFCPNGDRVFPRSGANCTAPLGMACLVHALSDGCAYGPRPRTFALVRERQRLRDAIARADAVIVNSRYVGDRARASAIPPSRIIEVPPPIPDDGFASAVLAEPAEPTVLFAGRIVPQKGLASLIRAIARIPAERRPLLRALGEGTARADAISLAARVGIAFHAPGAVAPSGVRDGIDAATMVAVPSLWAEPFGLIGVEAFARGRPAVAYDVGGVRSWLDDGRNGILVPRRDEARLSAAIERILADAAFRAALGAHARRDADAYGAARIAARTHEILTGCAV